jgi:hypothetical protein
VSTLKVSQARTRGREVVSSSVMKIMSHWRNLRRCRQRHRLRTRDPSQATRSSLILSHLRGMTKFNTNTALRSCSTSVSPRSLDTQTMTKKQGSTTSQALRAPSSLDAVVMHVKPRIPTAKRCSVLYLVISAGCSIGACGTKPMFTIRHFRKH